MLRKTFGKPNRHLSCLLSRTHEDTEETLRKAKTAASSAVGCSHACHHQKSRAAKAYVSQGERYGIGVQNVWFHRAKGMVLPSDRTNFAQHKEYQRITIPLNPSSTSRTFFLQATTMHAASPPFSPAASRNDNSRSGTIYAAKPCPSPTIIYKSSSHGNTIHTVKPPFAPTAGRESKTRSGIIYTASSPFAHATHSLFGTRHTDSAPPSASVPKRKHPSKPSFRTA